MDQKLKAKWVKALRSGKFKQARGTLCRGEKHLCCIGVGAVAISRDFKPTIATATWMASNVLKLPTETVDKLVHMNDYEKRTFKTIATYIEKNL